MSTVETRPNCEHGVTHYYDCAKCLREQYTLAPQYVVEKAKYDKMQARLEAMSAAIHEALTGTGVFTDDGRFAVPTWVLENLRAAVALDRKGEGKP